MPAGTPNVSGSPAEWNAAAGIAVPMPAEPSGASLGEASDAALALTGRAQQLAAELAELGGLGAAVDVVESRLPV